MKIERDRDPVFAGNFEHFVLDITVERDVRDGRRFRGHQRRSVEIPSLFTMTKDEFPTRVRGWEHYDERTNHVLAPRCIFVSLEECVFA